LKSKIDFEPLIGDWLGGFDYVHNVGKTFYFKTNYKADKSRLVAINLDSPQEENWKEIIPEHNNNVLQGADCCNNLIVASYLQDASDNM
jgi:prolyl oligopeptidase